jgi:hypothetical protein
VNLLNKYGGFLSKIGQRPQALAVATHLVRATTSGEWGIARACLGAYQCHIIVVFFYSVPRIHVPKWDGIRKGTGDD